MARSRFLTNYERRQRIDALLGFMGKDWTWLAKEMQMTIQNTTRALKAGPHYKYDPTLRTLKRAAIALNVSIGFLTDRTETKHDED